MTPDEINLQSAILTLAHRTPSTLPKRLAEFLLDAYGEPHAEAIADRLPGMIRKAHAARVCDATYRNLEAERNK